MKKLLSLLTIWTLTASVPAPLLANTVQTRVKLDVAPNEKYKEKIINGSYINTEFIKNIPIGTKVSGSDRNTYLKLIENDTWYLYKNNIEDEKSYSNKAVVDFFQKSDKLILSYPLFKFVTTGFDIKIKNEWNKIYANDKPFSKIDNKWYIAIWGRNNWNINKFKYTDWLVNISENLKTIHKTLKYFEKDMWGNEYLCPWEKFPQYFKAVYRWDGDGEPNLPEIDSNENITDWIVDKTPFQKGIKFSLAENNKNATWSNNGMRLTADGETNINIDNKNIEEVLWNGVKQNMLDHKVNINVKPETSEKTHKLVIKYDINGTKYTSEDIDVFMAVKIESAKPIVKENLSDVIKFDNNNDLGNVVDSNDDAIKAAITNKNARTVDFSQIKITDKTDTQATLTAKKDSKSYAGSVVVKYNVTSSTIVDLKIDVTPTSSTATVIKDYVGQIDTSNITNPVNTFYYANGKSTIKIKQPSTGNVITGKIYGCDDKWNKTSQSNTIDPVSGLEIDKGQYGSVEGRYLIELQHKDLSTHTKTIYLQITEKQKVEHYWDAPNGKNFEQWAEDNGEKNIRGSSASQLNNLFAVLKTWKKSLAHLDLKLDNFVVDNIQNVTQNEIDTYKTKLLAIVKSQVEKYVPNVVENIDHVISVDNLVAGDWTVSKDVEAQSVNGSTKMLIFNSKTIPVQQKEQAIPLTPDNKKDGDSKLWIIGVVGGVLAGLGLAYWLFKSFVFDKYFLSKIKKRRHDKLVEQVRKEEAEKNASEPVQKNRELDDEQNNKGGE